ncbi:MAG: hypothetical protein HYX37_20630 [Rhizobiales bacterium]|nr:hypothetical protein [Hyphomicrobiales bacterium]
MRFADNISAAISETLNRLPLADFTAIATAPSNVPTSMPRADHDSSD